MLKNSHLRRPIFLLTAVLIAAAILLTGCPETVNSPGTETLDVSLVLSGDAGGAPVLENASFSTATSSLTFTVSYLLEAIDIELNSEISGATVSINGQALTAGTKVNIPLSAGLNVIAVAVTPDSGTAVNYILNITRAEPPALSDNTDLATLELSTGYLSPVFDSAVVAYTSSVPEDTASITLVPTASDSAASITVDGSAVSSGAASAEIALTVGLAEAISVVVTAEDGDADKTYVVVVTRREEEDTDPPVITLRGDDPMVVAYGSTFTDPGANAVDTGDGSWVVYSSDTVDTNTAGDYVLTYNAEDLSENEAEPVTRTVTVSAKPPLELTDFYRRDIYSDAAYLHFEIIDSAYTVTVQGAGEVDSGTVEEYDNDSNEFIVYSTPQDAYFRLYWTDAVDGVLTETEYGPFSTIEDARTGSTGELSHTAYSTPADVPPFLILIGDETLFLDVGDAFTDEGATLVDWGVTNTVINATDLDDLNVTSAASGTYTLEYTSTDSDSNTAVPVTRTVIVGSGIADIIIQ